MNATPPHDRFYASLPIFRDFTQVMDPADIDKYILPVVALIVAISLLPIFVEIWRDRRAKRRGAPLLTESLDAEAR